MAALRSVFTFLALFLLVHLSEIMAQPCTELGQTPSTAFPVCGTSTFTQSTVPLCNTHDLFVPGCSGGTGADYANKNPFFYKFTCFSAGTLSFLITPLAANEDYDWQLWDITGRNPDDIFTDPSLVVTGNWAGTYGTTGASATGVTNIECGSSPTSNRPTFARSPVLVVGHEYLLLVSHFTDGQSGYTLNFAGGSAVITDPTEPHLTSAKPDCDGKTIRVKMNKKMRCASLTPAGSEFSISPAVTTVVSAVSTSCSSGFDFEEVVITLANSLPNGNYQLIINSGSDLNSLLDNCDRPIPSGEQVAFFYAVPQPIFADSLAKITCSPTSLKVYFPKRVACSTISADGSDFLVTGPSPVTVISAAGTCTDGLSDFITIQLASPIYTKGNYTLTLRAGNDGSTVLDECNIEMPQHSLPFTTADTVSAVFNITSQLGCRENTLLLAHDGAHDVNKWRWTFNDSIHASTQTHTIVFPATSSNTVSLFVTNGVCTDSVSVPIIMDNEVKAAFEMPSDICPEDLFTATDTSSGLIDAWQWSFGNVASSSLQEHAPVQFPRNNIESYYMVKLRVTNNAIGCTDSISKRLRVLNNCFIAVPTGFTPNNDGKNDYLYPNNAIKARDLEFRVYNRWGQQVFATRNWQEKWDGKINGILQAPGVFVWFLRYTHTTTGQQVFQKGTTTLIR
ncbi:MAG: gliding motility-associated C-terminal domain-containing protein [Chitinophagaceae bacterium]|nr:gliding motility-associated C-terminal domain-containing protein [Chitinophagaceae bacterium]